MAITQPEVSASVQFFAGRTDRVGGHAPLAAIVVGRSGTSPQSGITLMVLTPIGTTFIRSHVMHASAFAAGQAAQPDRDWDDVACWAYAPAGEV